VKLFKLIPNPIVKTGLIVIGLGIIALFLTYIRTFISPWRIKLWAPGMYIFIGILILVGVILILLDVIPKLHEKYFPNSFNNLQNKYRRRRTKAK
jgi:multisubunit Na+/H+ antiporter MnhB subunit